MKNNTDNYFINKIGVINNLITLNYFNAIEYFIKQL